MRDRGAVEKNGNFNLAHSLLRKARRASEADPKRERLSIYPDTAAKILELIPCCATIGFLAE